MDKACPRTNEKTLGLAILQDRERTRDSGMKDEDSGKGALIGYRLQRAAGNHRGEKQHESRT